ncbi:hypothetical protein GCM10023319_39820 [Nocardia iowensis]
MIPHLLCAVRSHAVTSVIAPLAGVYRTLESATTWDAESKSYGGQRVGPRVSRLGEATARRIAVFGDAAAAGTTAHPADPGCRRAPTLSTKSAVAQSISSIIEP